jgi:uncharacterized protein YyaL (SSP411 family)
VRTIVIVGNHEPESDELLFAALRTYLPRTAVRWFRAGAVAHEELTPELAAMMTGDAPRAYVCVGQACLPPVQTGPDLVSALQRERP